ncbi:hypothetical protein QTH87_18255 [Variovorax sp. J22P168]|uniref:hypothetical protein n=1 Tax=Variovorax jilinensis TaxID=3053513 RepID=UPI00257732EE|nr:hypothetical protein [Variovorax sp. J22P168]MDM0014389.1 hypothetical protein [Variovorax sp. J22P168]
MFGLTTLGVIHTAISLVALAAGLASILRYREIAGRTTLGQTYVWATVLTCLTGFGIFQRGGFGAPHVLGILTLVVLAVAAVAGRTQLFGRASRYVETIAYSTTLFFHMIPGLTETFTRFPAGAPLFSSPEDPALQKAVGVCFALLIVGCIFQVRRIRAGGAHGAVPSY